MADYSEIIDAIDAAVLKWAGVAVKIKSSTNREVEYRSLSDLTAARDYYVRLQNSSNRSGKGFTLNRFRAKPSGSSGYR